MKKEVLTILLVILMMVETGCGSSSISRDVPSSGKVSEGTAISIGDTSIIVAKSPVTEDKIKEDVVEVYGYPEGNVGDFIIEDRRTSSDSGTDYIECCFEVNRNSAVIAYNYRVYYNLYDQGWLLEDVISDGQEVVRIDDLSEDIVKNDLEKIAKEENWKKWTFSSTEREDLWTFYGYYSCEIADKFGVSTLSGRIYYYANEDTGEWDYRGHFEEDNDILKLNEEAYEGKTFFMNDYDDWRDTAHFNIYITINDISMSSEIVNLDIDGFIDNHVKYEAHEKNKNYVLEESFWTKFDYMITLSDDLYLFFDYDKGMRLQEYPDDAEEIIEGMGYNSLIFEMDIQ